MKTLIFRLMIVSIFTSLFVFLIGRQQVQAQQEKHLNLNDIRETLVFRSGVSKTTEEINEQLITDIRKRGVDFMLSTEDEGALKKAGGSDLLIKSIRENLPKRLEKNILYRKFLTNYDGTIKQMKIAVEAAKEYVRKFSDDDDKDVKEIIDYFKAVIPELEKAIAIREKNKS